MKPYPLRFVPLLKQTIWGGRLLGERMGKPIGEQSNYAESWEVVDHGADQSVVATGHLAGRTLAGLLAEHPSWLMGDAMEPQFPLLLKYLDCHRVLSVQVHPDDRYAASMRVPDRGKTEAWFIVDAQPGAILYAGLKAGVDASALRAAIQAGSAEELLHRVHPQVGDCVFIPAGTVHAIGAGLLVAEIQQSSDTTFRLYDWNRVDETGHSRELHVEQGLEVTDFDSGPVQPRRASDGKSGWQSLVQCDSFHLQSLQSGTERIGGDGVFHILSVPHGTACVRSGSDETPLARGESVLLPAAHPEAIVQASEGATVLEAHVEPC